MFSRPLYGDHCSYYGNQSSDCVIKAPTAATKAATAAIKALTNVPNNAPTMRRYACVGGESMCIGRVQRRWRCAQQRVAV